MTERYIIILKCDQKRKSIPVPLYKEVVDTLVRKEREFHFRTVKGWKGHQVSTAFIVVSADTRWTLHYDLGIPLEHFMLHTTEEPLFSWK